jgi:hypothetical protein
MYPKQKSGLGVLPCCEENAEEDITREKERQRVKNKHP